ncbi:DEAD/DEAH box helicase [Caldisphaera sp.]|uniref:DEAD/DEAH box helicase n=1 Tax=Caldisphaera sp. TaxID=2060322 RepID=UPI00397A2DE1
MSKSSDLIEKYSFIVKEASIESGETEINGFRLRKFQEELYDSLGKYKNVLLNAPTGSGKTFTLILGAIKSAIQGSYPPVVGIYPSKALVYDQARSVRKTLRNMNLKENKDNSHIGLGCDRFEGTINICRQGTCESINVPVNTCVLTSEVKELPSEFTPSNEVTIVFTVPEYPFMILSGMKKQYLFSKVIETSINEKDFYNAIKNVKVHVHKNDARQLLDYFALFFNGYWFIDEFHLYTGISRASLKTLIEMRDNYNSKTREVRTTVFSSATPVNLNYDKSIEANYSGQGDIVRKKTLVNFFVTISNPQEALSKYINDNPIPNEPRTAIILDRVYYITKICETINNGTVVWGLNKSHGGCKKISQGLENERLIIGDLAMSYGIDLDFDLGYIHAHDAETLIQRFGRIGRHGVGQAEVNVFIKGNFSKEELKKLNKEINYRDFLEIINKIYRKRIDDGLDKIFFSKIRHNALIKAFSLIYALAQGEFVYDETKQWYELIDNVKLNTRPSFDDIFYVLAFRPGGLKGKWCDSGEDELFTMLRNFRYNSDNGCFNYEPLKEAPFLIPRNDIIERIKKASCDLMTFNDFVKLAHPSLVLLKQNVVIPLDEIKDLKSSYVVLLKRNCVQWDNFSEMAELVATYENALVIYSNPEKNGAALALAIFI